MDKDKQPPSLQDEKIREVTAKIKNEYKPDPARQEIFDRINNSPGSADTATAENPLIQTPKDTSPSVKIKNLRTYQGDVAEIVKQKNASVLSIAMAERQKQQRVEAAEKTTEPKETKVKKEKEKTAGGKNVLTIITSLILIIVGVGLIAGLFIIQNKKPASSVNPFEETPIIGWSKVSSHDISGLKKKDLEEIVNSSRDSEEIAQNGVLYIRLTETVGEIERAITVQDFLPILQTKIPGALLRSFRGNFMLGIINLSQNYSFLLIEISSFDNAFAGMLNWEKTLYQDLGGLLSKQRLTAIPGTPAGSSSTTPAITTATGANIISSPSDKFEDLTIRNKDTRVLRNIGGEILVLYSFLDKNTLLITNNENVLRDMVNRVISGRLVR